MAAKVKKGDRVVVLTGRNKGAEGEVRTLTSAINTLGNGPQILGE